MSGESGPAQISLKPTQRHQVRRSTSHTLVFRPFWPSPVFASPPQTQEHLFRPSSPSPSSPAPHFHVSVPTPI
jgi:hypothetical protein